MRETREKMGWSQAELAERTGVSRDTVGRIERGQLPDAVFLGSFSELAGVSCDWLVLGRESRGGPPGEPGAHGREELDEAVLAGVIEGVEEELLELGASLEPKKKAELVALLYEMMGSEEGPQPGRSRITKMIKLAI
ncbi:MAG: helix-turn-helix transcriptional regulator [Deferrisomatales bacterium]|nr:helix-turn-helix transcriptional regulator [Deferrisomatales bacterium]